MIVIKRNPGLYGDRICKYIQDEQEWEKLKRQAKSQEAFDEEKLLFLAEFFANHSVRYAVYHLILSAVFKDDFLKT